MTGAERQARDILSRVGVAPNGSHPFDPEIHDARTYGRVLAGGSLALGESYMDHWWDAEDLPEFVRRVIGLGAVVKPDLRTLFYLAKARLMNLQSRARAGIVSRRHYDIGNDLYEKMLGLTMAYSCGYWSGSPRAKNLEEAQTAKFDLICRKLNLQKGQRVLDVGCGFGTFAEYAVKNYGVSVLGVTVSEKHTSYAKKRVAGLPVEIHRMDYRSLAGSFDHVVSVGMFEHVGYKNYRTYFEKIHSVLADDGLFLLHTIGGNHSVHTADPWLNKYIFPNGMLPSIAQIGRAIEGLFVMEDWHNFGADYEKTLLAWFRNFNAAWPALKERYGLPAGLPAGAFAHAGAPVQAGERFYRMWKYYLLSSAGTFRARDHTELWQIILSPKGVPGGYTPVR